MKILIPCSKNSSRFAGKNALLIPYTVAYLDKVQTLTKEPLQVFVAMTDETLPLKDKFFAKHVKFNFLTLPDEVKNQHMQTLVEKALEAINPDIDEPIILLQLTQPLRSLSLIDEALQVYQSSPNRAVMSYILGPEAWRVLDSQGNYQAHLRAGGELLKIHDGSIYVFNPMTYLQLWDKSPKSSVQNKVDELIDIDYQSQYDPQNLTELCKHYI